MKHGWKKYGILLKPSWENSWHTFETSITHPWSILTPTMEQPWKALTYEIFLKHSWITFENSWNTFETLLKKNITPLKHPLDTLKILLKTHLQKMAAKCRLPGPHSQLYFCLCCITKQFGLISTKIWIQKNFGTQKFGVQNRFLVKKVLIQNKFCPSKMVVQKVAGEKRLCSQQKLVWTKCWSE